MATVKNFKIKSPIESTVANGTSPLVTVSTTKVINLNSDLLDGYHADINATPNTIPIRDNTGLIAVISSDSNFNFIDASSGPVTFTLPDPSTTSLIYIIKKLDGSNNNITINSAGTNKTIDGQSSIIFKKQYTSYSIKSYSGQWYII